MNDLYSYPVNDYRSYLQHSAKGTHWKNHKYVKIVNGRYIYPEQMGGGKSTLKRTYRTKGLDTFIHWISPSLNAGYGEHGGSGRAIIDRKSDAFSKELSRARKAYENKEVGSPKSAQSKEYLKKRLQQYEDASDKNFAEYYDSITNSKAGTASYNYKKSKKHRVSK